MDEHEGEVILKLTCNTCDNSSCFEGHSYAPIDSLMGCIR